MTLYPLWHCLDDKSKKALGPFLSVTFKEPSNAIKHQKVVPLDGDEDETLKEIDREMRKKPHYSKQGRS
jgi:hypothetical protein